MSDALNDIDPIQNHDFRDALSQRYLVYALSTITARSLPDVRDGLKPVHRRLLWAMRLLRLDPAAGYKKCARVVGDTIGKYHPHGDQSVYDAMVRLAQDFSLRYPLVDGQGNFGNIDGDNAAAYRYTEARLTPAAIDLMAGLDEGTVDFRPTYNNEEEEPEVFPGLFPNLLANGASGIAVGMATSIPPHNLAEIIDAAIVLIKDPRADHAALMDKVQGPDFPTGGVLVDSPEVIASAYATGRGAFRVRGRFSTGQDSERKWEAGGIEKLPQGMWQLIISEIPYQVPKNKLIEQIAALISDKKLPILADVRDESDARIRIVIEPRSRTIDPQLLKESLFRLTDLEVRVPLNMNVLDADRTPRVMGLKEVLSAWIAHQFRVLMRRSQYRIGKIDDRLELLEGYIIAFLNLDRVIEIIRTEDEPKPVMIAEFALNDRQAEAILNMRLRSLRRLEEMQLRGERDQLDRRARGARGPGQRTEASAQTAGQGPDRAPRPLRQGPRARRPPHPDRGGGAGPRDPARGDDRARADNRDHVAAGLDPGDEGPCRSGRGGGAEVQGGGRRPLLLPRPHHRQIASRRRGRPLLHAGRRPAAGRARLRRAGQADGRRRGRGEYRHPVPGRRGRQAPARHFRRARLHHLGGGRRRRDPQGQAGGQSQARRPAEVGSADRRGP